MPTAVTSPGPWREALKSALENVAETVTKVTSLDDLKEQQSGEDADVGTLPPPPARAITSPRSPPRQPEAAT